MKRIKIAKIMKNLKKIDIKKNLKWILPALLLAGAIGAYYRYGIVAVVNGKNISRLSYIKNLEKQSGKQVLEQMIVESMIEQEAVKNKIKIEDSEIKAGVTKVEEQVKSQSQTLESALAAEGMTLADLERQIKIEKMIEKLSDPKKEITEAQIAEFLSENKARLPKGASKEELNKLAKSQLESQIKAEAASNWFSKLKEGAKIIYR